MRRRSCQNPDNCRAAGRGGPCRICDAAAIANRAVMLRERIAANQAEGRSPYAQRPVQEAGQERGSSPEPYEGSYSAAAPTLSAIFAPRVPRG